MSQSTDLKKPLIIYQENKIKVVNSLKEGKIDYMDLSGWDFQDRFFAFLFATRFFEVCGCCYPTPRFKEEVPVWFLLACQTQLKLHQEPAYHKLPGILNNGPILSRLHFDVGGAHGGFNKKNKKPRTVPIHHDGARKFFKDTDRKLLKNWYNDTIVNYYHHHRVFDKHGIFILDQTHLVVPSNKNYEASGAQWALVDEHGQRIDTSHMNEDQKKILKPRLCFSLSLLSHLGSDNSQIISGYCLGGGGADELSQGPEIVSNFVKRVGKGIIKILITDRGYIDGRFISELKTRHSIDVVIPLRSNMTALDDSKRIAKHFMKKQWTTYRCYKKDHVKYTEEVVVVGDIEDWEKCGLKLHVSLMRITGSDGSERYWGLVTTFKPKHSKEAFELYNKRTRIEELNKQLKESWLIHKFSSPSSSLIESQVLFTLLVYSLIQIYLSKKHLEGLLNKTIQSLREEERLGINSVIIYKGEYFAVLDLDYYTEIIAKLEETAKNRLLKWIDVSRKKWNNRGS